MVAFAIPASWLWYSGQTHLAQPLGLALLALGTLALLWCVRDFYVCGRGTLAPWAPPQRLVVIGLYRYSRNPMYLCVALVLIGWSVSFASSDLVIYTLAVAVAFHLRIVLGEEPWLARTHGIDWEQYITRVRRWF